MIKIRNVIYFRDYLGNKFQQIKDGIWTLALHIPSKPS